MEEIKEEKVVEEVETTELNTEEEQEKLFQSLDEETQNELSNGKGEEENE